ncbi:MAG TPA: hypothetical protein VH308_03190 [Terracidiphilus sp.]|jgi:hypothetical protein|nr:hypothetical protein [Terracidiphilus sp.]
MPLLARFRDRNTDASLTNLSVLGAGPLGIRNESHISPQKSVLHVPGLFSTCSNPRCNSGWLRLWRSRSAPVVEGGWCCSPECTAAQIASALRREVEMLGHAEAGHRHRVPLGLVMLEQGWITKAQLRGALEAQRAVGSGRLGHWLVRQQGVSEQLITRGLGLQWSCPVLGLELHDPESLTALVPRLFVDAFGALPLRVAAGKIIYLGFEDRLDPALALAVEQMTGLRVESGLIRESLFRPAHARMMQAKFPSVELIEAASEPVLAQALARRIERVRPVESRLVRMHDCLWLRMWTQPQRRPIPEAAHVHDLICSLRPH